LVVAEPTGLRLGIAHRGAVWLRATTVGKAAHGSMPQLGTNAILHMCRLVERLQQQEFEYRPHPLLDPPTINIGTLCGGTKINVVPDRCQAEIDIRTVPGQSAQAIVNDIHGLIGDLQREEPSLDARIELISERPAVQTDPCSTLVQSAQRVARSVWGQEGELCGLGYFTDASVLVQASGVRTLIVGPGEAGMAHQADEWVAVDRLVLAAQFYAALALELLVA